MAVWCTLVYINTDIAHAPMLTWRGPRKIQTSNTCNASSFAGSIPELHEPLVKHLIWLREWSNVVSMCSWYRKKELHLVWPCQLTIGTPFCIKAASYSLHLHTHKAQCELSIWRSKCQLSPLTKWQMPQNQPLHCVRSEYIASMKQP